MTSKPHPCTRLQTGTYLYRNRCIFRREEDRFKYRPWKIAYQRGTNFRTLAEAKEWVDERYERAAAAVEAAKQETPPPPST